MNSLHSLYIHIPFCFSKCKYCDFFSVTELSKENRIPDAYISALCNEIDYRIKTLSCKEIETVYIGGGTPSLMTQNQLSEILNTVKKNAHICEGCEITIEVNPDDVTTELLEMFETNGITRISVGIQSMNDSVLKYVGRRAGVKENLNALEIIKKNWKKDFSLDLISALPFETAESFMKGLEQIVSFEPDHISLYSLTIEEETPLGQLLEKNAFPYDVDFADEMWLEGKKFLQKNGYLQYEVSNFAKLDKQCRHNLTYWNHKNYIGAGSGATGTFYPNRWTNSKNIKQYIDFWTDCNNNIDYAKLPQQTEKLSIEEIKFEFFMMGLRKSAGITDKEYFVFFDEAVPSGFLNLFNKWHEKKLACIEKKDNVSRYFLNEQGLLYLNNFLEQLEL